MKQQSTKDFPIGWRQFMSQECWKLFILTGNIVPEECVSVKVGPLVV